MLHEHTKDHESSHIQNFLTLDPSLTSHQYPARPSGPKAAPPPAPTATASTAKPEDTSRQPVSMYAIATQVMTWAHVWCREVVCGDVSVSSWCVRDRMKVIMQCLRLWPVEFDHTQH